MTAVRSQVPVPAPVPQPATAVATHRPVSETMPPVAATLRKDAVRQPGSAPAGIGVHLAEGDGRDQQAAVAAEAAREAYIRAAIAAGISPLPLP